jgi:hypothetical protein
MAQPKAIEIEGLEEFRKELREIDPDLPKARTKAGKTAARLVSDDARSRAGQLGGVHNFVKSTIRPFSTSKAAGVRLGGKGGTTKRGRKNAASFGAEFGSKQYKQFPAWRGNQWEDTGNVGYMVHPAIREKLDEVMTIYANEVTRIMRDAYPD